MANFGGFRVKSREGKIASRAKMRANPVNGIAMKRLLVERAAKAQKVAQENRHLKASPL